MLSTPARAGSSLGGGLVAHAALAWAVPKCVQWWTSWPGSESGDYVNQRHFTSAENQRNQHSHTATSRASLRAYCDCAGCEGGKPGASSARVRPLREPTVFPVRMRILTKPASSSPSAASARNCWGPPSPPSEAGRGHRRVCGREMGVRRRGQDIATPTAGHLRPSPSNSPPLANHMPPYPKGQPMSYVIRLLPALRRILLFPLGSLGRAGLGRAGVGLGDARRPKGQ